MKTWYYEEISNFTKNASEELLGQKVIIHHTNVDLQKDDLTGVITEIEYADNFPLKPIVLIITNVNGIKKSIVYVGIKKIEFLNTDNP